MLSQHLQNIQSLSHGMDVIIVSVTSDHEEVFWQKRLDQMRGQIVKDNALIITVVEDWENGAGNALGTFYAFTKAAEIAQKKYHIDLIEKLKADCSIAIYHTAGKGTRLTPMTGCEYNSKSRIKLIGRLWQKNYSTPITLLEAVIKQTSILAPHRKGRLSVFWGDQLFIPSKPLKVTSHEIDLLVKPIEHRPTEKEWQDNGYSKYGFVIINSNGEMRQLEKLSYQDFSSLSLKSDEKLAFSLGSFSLSERILSNFLTLFSNELKQKTGSFDSDPHLWMPLSLEKKLYTDILVSKGASVEFAQSHFERLSNFKTAFNEKFTPKTLLGTSSMGAETLWWDYGNMQSYYENCLKLVADNPEAQALKDFFSIPQKNENRIASSQLEIENSILINCSIHKGKIKNCVLINVTADEINSSDSVLINSSAQSIEANGSILYNALENGKILIDSNQVRADNFSEENGHIKLFNTIHPHLPWDKPVEGNPLSFKDLHQFNQQTNPVQGQQLAQTMHNKIKQAVFDLQK